MGSFEMLTRQFGEETEAHINFIQEIEARYP